MPIKKTQRHIWIRQLFHLPFLGRPTKVAKLVSRKFPGCFRGGMGLLPPNELQTSRIRSITGDPSLSQKESPQRPFAKNGELFMSIESRKNSGMLFLTKKKHVVVFSALYFWWTFQLKVPKLFRQRVEKFTKFYRV